MYFFIAIIFISELIITVTILKWIWNTDKAVCNFNKKVTKSKAVITNAIVKFRKDVHCLEQSAKFVICYVNQKREEFIIKIIKSILTYLLVVIIEVKFNKIVKLKKWVKFGKSFVKRLLAQ